jgi:hypothetical protein
MIQPIHVNDHILKNFSKTEAGSVRYRYFLAGLPRLLKAMLLKIKPPARRKKV